MFPFNLFLAIYSQITFIRGAVVIDLFKVYSYILVVQKITGELKDLILTENEKISKFQKISSRIMVLRL